MVATQGPADALGLVGSTIDQVRFDACADAGGFGLIYRGFHEGLGEAVAIKCLRIASIQRTNEEIREALAGRFRDETKLLYRLSQGNLDIVRCISSGTLVAPKTKEYTPYMVLEWLEGCTLSAELRQRRERHLGVRTLEEAVKLLDSAVGGIAYAHAHDVVHRDVKPGNLFLTRTREGVRMKVLDFGLAKILSDEAIGVRPSVETGIGVHFCSPSYGAPEQYTSSVGKIGPWTDVYSLCLVLYEILLGDKVRPAGNLAEGLMKAIDPVTGSPSASDLGLKLPRAVEDLLKRALAQNPLDRPHDAGVFWAQLKEAMSAPAGADFGATVADDGLGGAMQQVRDAAILRAAAREKGAPFAGTMLMRSAPTGAPHLGPQPASPVPAAGRPPTPGGAMPPVVIGVSRSTAPLRPPRQAASQGTMAMTVPFGAQSPLAASMAIPSPIHNAPSSIHNAPSSGPPPAYAGSSSGPPPPDYAQQQQQPPQQQQQQQQPDYSQQQPQPDYSQQQQPQQQLSSYPPEGSARPGPRAAMATDPRIGVAPVSGRKTSSGGGLIAMIGVCLLVLLGFSYYWFRVRGH